MLVLESRIMQTGFPRADARDDFDRARRQARWAKLAAWLSGQPSGANRLKLLGEVTIVAGAGAAMAGDLRPQPEHAGSLAQARQAAVPIDTLVGSVEPTMSFDRHFRPTSQVPRDRFQRIAISLRRGRGMDPVELYHCGGEYFVLDGHHRIAVARALGERSVWAMITEVRPVGPARAAGERR
jgi:hypothetical protein